LVIVDIGSSRASRWKR